MFGRIYVYAFVKHVYHPHTFRSGVHGTTVFEPCMTFLQGDVTAELERKV